MEKLPVIFRRPRSKSMFEIDGVTAVFPTLPWNNSGGDFTIYAHIGQHGGASHGWYYETRAAKPEEYSDLLRELQRIYSRPDDPEAVELVIYKRMTPQHREANRIARRR